MNRINRPWDDTHALRDSLMQETQKTSYQRCLVNNRCHTGKPVIGGHLIPQNYLRRLPGEHNMAVFATRRFGRPLTERPIRQGIGDTTVGYFTCKPHDDMFQEVDRLSDIYVMPDQRVLDLMCYRNVLYTRWWMHLWAQASQRARDQHGAEHQYKIAEILQTDDKVLLDSQRLLERCMGTDAVERPSYSHLMLTSEGKPMLAAAVFGVLQVQLDSAGKEQGAKFGQCGLTLIPGHCTNSLFVHFPSATGTEIIDMVLPGLAGRSRVTGREVTRAIFASCYDVVFSQASWAMLAADEQHQIKMAMTGQSRIGHWTIDAFKGSDWTVV